MGAVYVLLQSDRRITGTNKGYPVGVVSDQSVANDFYQTDSEHRDWLLFNLDEVPEHTGIPGTPTTTPPVDANYVRMQKEVDEAHRRTLETSKKVDELVNKLKRKRF